MINIKLELSLYITIIYLFQNLNKLVNESFIECKLWLSNFLCQQLQSTIAEIVFIAFL